MTPAEAEVIAHAVAIIRPQWQADSMFKMLANHRHRPARQVALALVYLAYDPDVKSPGLLNHDGPHWSVGQLGDATYTPPALAEVACPTHGDRQPCRCCEADRKAAPTPDVAPAPDRLPGESLAAWVRRVAELETSNEQEQQ